MIGINAMKKQIDIAKVKVKVKVITVIKATVKHLLKIQQHHQDHQVLIRVDRLSRSTSGSRSNGSTSNNNTSTHKNNTSSENGASSDIGTSVSESEDTSGDSQTEQSIKKSSYDGLGGE